MASSSDQNPSKRRAGRVRQPPLAPGPAFQFVVANHPDDFKDGKTMRKVRSHVMYTHREGLSPTDTVGSQEGSSTPNITTRTPSPAITGTSSMSPTNISRASTSSGHRDSVWEQDARAFQTPSPSAHPVRVLAARIHSAITQRSTHTEPPVFGEVPGFPFPGGSASCHEPLDDLKREWISTTNFYCYGTSLSILG
jgi:hypothetical protein